MPTGETREREEHRRVQRADLNREHAARDVGAGSITNTPHYSPSMLASANIRGRGNGPVHIGAMQQAQQTHGNRAVQRFMQRNRSLPAVQRQPLVSVQRDAQIPVDKGTTEELKMEQERLKRERDTHDPSGCTLIDLDRRGHRWDCSKYDELISKLAGRIAERGNSTLADCNIGVEFNGSNLNVTGTSTQSFTAVSGKPASDGSFDYSPERQKQENVGPIPEGTYWLDPTQLKSLWYYFGGAAAAWGSHRITIHPFDSTHTFGRGGFFIHGGTSPGSAGCIDLTGQMEDFAKVIAPYKDCKIMLRVHYPAKGGK
jgi:hypothetical protein